MSPHSSRDREAAVAFNHSDADFLYVWNESQS